MTARKSIDVTVAADKAERQWTATVFYSGDFESVEIGAAFYSKIGETPYYEGHIPMSDAEKYRIIDAAEKADAKRWREQIDAEEDEREARKAAYGANYDAAVVYWERA